MTKLNIKHLLIDIRRNAPSLSLLNKEFRGGTTRASWDEAGCEEEVAGLLE